MAEISQQTLNVLRVSCSMMILFTAVLSHETITEPLISGLAHAGIGGMEHKDGYLSLCIVYFFNTISCFFAPYLVSKLSGKWSMIVGMITVLCYQISYLFPNRYGILSISALVGVGTTFLWVGHGQYISENVSDRNREKNTSMQWAFFKMSLIYGGVFFYFYFQNASIESIVVNGQMRVFLIIFMICTALSLINTFFLPQSEMSQNRVSLPFYKTSMDCFKLLKTRRMIYLALFFFYTGLVKSFWISIYPACIKFTNQLATNTTTILTIGMIVTGCGQVIGSVFVAIIGERIRKFGQHILILSALILHIILFIMISFTFPNESPLGHTDKKSPIIPSSVFLAMIISFFLGFGDAILQTQIYSYIAKYYQKESGSVFSIYRFSSGIASTTLFFSAQYFYLLHHLTILTISACIGGFSILAFHKLIKKELHLKAPIIVVAVNPRITSTVSPLPMVRI